MTALNPVSAKRSPSPEQQLALQLFADLIPTKTPIANSPEDIGFNISQALVDLKDLTLLARKALIGCYFLAATENSQTTVYDFDLGFYKWLINYSSSNNLDQLKDALVRAQKSLIQMNIIDPVRPERDKWASVHLMGDVMLARGRITFTLPPRLAAELSNPNGNGVMMYLSLRIQANFTSIYAQTLYAKIVPLKLEGCSPWMSLPEFAQWMNVDQYEWAKEFRYLNRDVIKVAVEQINKHSDMELKVETRTARGSRKIEFVRFVIEDKPTDDSWLASVNDIATEKHIYEVLTDEFSMDAKDLDKVKAGKKEWTNERLLEAIEFTRNRLKDTRLEIIRRPGNFFLKALELGLKVPNTAREAEKKANAAFELQQREEVRKKAESAKQVKTVDATRQKVLAEFSQLPDDRQAALWHEYRVSSSTKMFEAFNRQIEKKQNDGAEMAMADLLKDKKVANAFSTWVEKQLKD